MLNIQVDIPEAAVPALRRLVRDVADNACDAARDGTTHSELAQAMSRIVATGVLRAALSRVGAV